VEYSAKIGEMKNECNALIACIMTEIVRWIYKYQILTTLKTANYTAVYKIKKG